MQTFIRNALHWAAGLAAALAVGPLAGAVLARVFDERGDHVVSLLGASNALMAVVGTALVFVGALVMGRVGRAIGGVALGMMCAGLVMAWGAYGLGNVEEAVRGTQSGSFFGVLAGEGLVLGLLAAGLMLHLAMPSMHEQGEPSGSTTGKGSGLVGAVLGGLVRVRNGSGMGTLLQCVLVSAVVVAAVGALCATHVGRGQSIFAAFCGALAAGVAAQVTAAAAQARISPAVPALGLSLAALAGPIIAIVLHGNALVPDALAGNLAWVSRILPLDWAAGAVLGVHVGMGWAGATLAQHAEGDEVAARA
jgi:hypothetical protein